MAAVQATDVRASFRFVGDLNGHHQEWLGSTTTNRHGVAAFHFVTVSGCDQLVVGPTHENGGTLHLLMTDVFPCWLDGMYQPRASVCVTRINLGLMINADLL